MDMPTSSPNTWTAKDCDSSDLNSFWIYSSIFTISALGIPLNLLVLLVFLLHQKKCNSTEIYLSNLAAADLFLVVLMCFWGIYVAIDPHSSFEGPMCAFASVLFIMNYNCSIYFLVLVSIDRFFALVYPLKQCILRRRKYAILACFLVWCFCLLLNIPTLICKKSILLNVLPYNEPEPYICGRDCSIDVYYINEMIQTIIAFIIPLLIILFCTVKIVHALTRRLSNRDSTQQTEHKATILVLTVFLAFFICWSPFSITRIIGLAVRMNLIEDTCSLSRHLYNCRIIFLNFGFFNSDLNPLLYVIVGKNFRKKMWEVGRCIKNIELFPSHTSISNTGSVPLNC